MKEAILYIGLAQSLFAILVMATKERVSVSDRILIACLTTIALRFLTLLLYREYPQIVPADFSMGLVPLTFGPFLLLYTIYLIDDRKHFNPVHYWHFAPFVGVSIIYYLFLAGRVSFDEVTYFEKDGYLWVRMIFATIFFGSVISYTLLTLLKLYDYKKSIDLQHSSDSSRRTLNWLGFITLLFSITFLIYFVAGGINALTFSRKTDMQTLTHVGLTLLAYTVSYFGLRQPAYSPTSRRKQPAAHLKISKLETRRNSQKQRILPTEAEKLTQRLIRHMEEEKPFLDPELTLKELSRQIDLSNYELTELLNGHIGKNFFTFVNEFRVDEVIRKMEDPNYHQPTIMAIAYDSGFNSKSTFNSFFKQYTGQTPSEFKKKIIKS
jgi:AraC-like DNA-binding protein